MSASTALGRLSREVRPFQSHQVHQLIAHAPGASMPSDHATAAFAIAFGVGLFLSRRWGVVLGIAGAVIGGLSAAQDVEQSARGDDLFLDYQGAVYDRG
jgi:membrane-associated phospholipid phosphatase